MTSIIEELYYGNIRPGIRRYGPHSPYMEAVGLKNKNQQDLLATLNEDEKELFEKYCDAQADIEGIVRYDLFAYGIKLGLLLMGEAFTGTEDILSAQEL